MSEENRTIEEIDKAMDLYIDLREDALQVYEVAADDTSAQIYMSAIVDSAVEMSERYNQLVQDYMADPKTTIAMFERMQQIAPTVFENNVALAGILEQTEKIIGDKIASNPDFYSEKFIPDFQKNQLDALSQTREGLIEKSKEIIDQYLQQQSKEIDVVVSDALARDCGVEECTDAEEAIQALQERYNAAEAAISDDTMSPMDKLEVYTDYLDGYKEALTSLGERGVPEEIAEESVSRLIGIPPQGLSDKGADYQEILADQVRDMVSMADNIEITGSPDQRKSVQVWQH